MNLAELSIKRPVFITCLMALLIVLGLMSYKKMPVDQFPDVTFPIVFAEIAYPGASPVDVERQISKIVEDEVSSLSGLETVSSYNYDSVAIIVIKFKLGIDIKEAEQQVRNRIQNVKARFPSDAKDPVIRRFDPADQPILTIALNSKMNAADLYDVANEKVKPLLERINDVGLVRIVGGQKKEIKILVDKNKLQEYQLSMIQIAKKIEDIEVIEEIISPFDLQKADELFITNVIIGIQPITKYRKKEFGTWLSEQLLEKLNAMIES